MSGLKTLVRAGLFLLLALPAKAKPLAMQFAACSGRFSALMEHQWLLSAPEAGQTGLRGAAMISLLEAVMPGAAPADYGRRVLARRIEAKFAHAALLGRSVFNDDAEPAGPPAAPRPELRAVPRF